jgi:hypothetical protein
MNNTLSNLLTPEELEIAKQIANGTQELDEHDELYEKLFNHYCDSGEMPYGTMKARTGDPFNWITDQLTKELC